MVVWTMPDNSNPKMKQALFFHRNKNQAPTSTRKNRQTEPVGWQTYNLLTGKKQRSSSFLNIFWRETKEATTTECEKRRRGVPIGEDDVRFRYRNTLSGREPAYHADVCFGQSICHGQGRKQNIWSVDLPWARKETKYVVSWSALGKEGNKICGQLIWPRPKGILRHYDQKKRKKKVDAFKNLLKIFFLTMISCGYHLGITKIKIKIEVGILTSPLPIACHCDQTFIYIFMICASFWVI
jgi:hypothetical protein